MIRIGASRQIGSSGPAFGFRPIRECMLRTRPELAQPTAEFNSA